MRRTNINTDRRHAAAGFTLVEMIISLVLMGIVAMVMIPLLQMPMNGYIDAQRRTELQSQMELIRAKLSDDLASALPGSLRIRIVGNTQYLEYLEVKAIGRYQSGAGGPGFCPATTCTAGDSLALSCAAETCMTTLGPLLPVGPGGTPTPQNTDYISVLPGGGAIAPSAYSTAALSPTSRLNVAPVGVANGGWELRFAAHNFQSDNPQKRFYLIRQPVSYVCTPATAATAGTLVKRWGGNYTLAAVQPTAFGTASTATLSTRIGVGPNACHFYLAAFSATVPQNLRQTLSVQLVLATLSGAGTATEQTQSEMQFVVKEP